MALLDPIVSRLGKDVAGKIHRCVHTLGWKQVNREYFDQLDGVENHGPLRFKDKDKPGLITGKMPHIGDGNEGRMHQQ